MMGECNCARMPAQNSFGRVGLNFAFPVFKFFFDCFLLFLLVNLQVFSLKQPFILAFLQLIFVFFCVVILVLCV